MPVQNAQELFVHELSDMYDAEQRIAQMLPELAKEAQDTEFKDALQQHLQETQQQIRNLEQVFQLIGQQPQRQTCFAVQGIKQEHDSFVKEKPSAEILQMFDLGGSAKTEHYEIASYEGLIEQCNEMGQKQCADLLKQNLQQEQAMAKRVDALSKRLGKQLVSSGT
jgi:ferritin-like metal-binding protein YciE